MTIRLNIFLTCCVLVLAFSGIGNAGDFNGNIDLLCKIQKGIEAHADNQPYNFMPESVGLPATFILNFKKKLILPTRDSVVRRQSRIRHLTRVENKLILQGTDAGIEGVEDGIGWTMSLTMGSGKFVISAAGDRVGYTVFGSCNPEVTTK